MSWAQGIVILCLCPWCHESLHNETATIELLLCTGSWTRLLLSLLPVKFVPVYIRPTLRKVRLSVPSFED